jgi:hypothetical protein
MKLWNTSSLTVALADLVTWTKKMFMEIFMVGAWSIWEERNAFVFEGVAPDILSWKLRFTTDFKLLVRRTKPDLHPFIHSLVGKLSLSIDHGFLKPCNYVTVPFVLIQKTVGAFPTVMSFKNILTGLVQS